MVFIRVSTERQDGTVNSLGLAIARRGSDTGPGGLRQRNVAFRAQATAGRGTALSGRLHVEDITQHLQPLVIG